MGGSWNLPWEEVGFLDEAVWGVGMGPGGDEGEREEQSRSWGGGPELTPVLLKG